MIARFKTSTKNLRKLENTHKRKSKSETRIQHPVFSLERKFDSFLIKNRKNETLNVYVKKRYSVEPSNFPGYFAHDSS